MRALCDLQCDKPNQCIPFQRLMALVYYLMAAESGFASSQFNVAYLCEQNPVSSFNLQLHLQFCHMRCTYLHLLYIVILECMTTVFCLYGWGVTGIRASWNFLTEYRYCSPQGGFLTQAFVKQCMLRYYNLTIQSQDPDAHGNWLKITSGHCQNGCITTTCVLRAMLQKA